MNGMLLLVGSIVYFLLAYFLYGRFVAKRFGVDPKRATPAHTQEDGIDYVPSHPAVLFGHHFASIAGAGPIIGPIVAASFGWGKYVGSNGLVMGIDHFGESAPCELLAKEYGFTAEAVAEHTLKYLGK